MVDYLGFDFLTTKNSLIEYLQQTDQFKDYDFEGSNISILLELFSYVNELNSYYINQIAKNIFMDSSNLYENVHRLSNFLGYVPKGYIASRTDLTVTVQTSATNIDENDELYIPVWTNFESGNYNFLSVDTITVTASTGNIEFIIPVKQGTQTQYDYTGTDIFDNKIILPFEVFDCDNDLTDDEESVWVTVNGTPWSRVNDFYNDVSGLYNESNVFRFCYDRYKRSILEFSSDRNVPEDTSEIQITLIKTDYEDGNVGQNSITGSPDNNIVYNLTKNEWISNDYITITNKNASGGGVSAETMDSIKSNAKNFFYTQYRLSNKNDYKYFLEKRSDVSKANAWGENEESLVADTRMYNKIYLSMVPSYWSTYTIETSAFNWTVDNGKSSTILIPTNYASSYTEDIGSYLEPYKTINSYLIYRVPQMIYFAFDIGISIYKSYNYTDVIEDIMNKLQYYFALSNRMFGDTIDFREVKEYIKDSSIISEDNSFSNIKGIKYLTYREVYSSVSVYEPNDILNYPQYTLESFDNYIDNVLRPIQLGHNQYPSLEIDLCKFTLET